MRDKEDNVVNIEDLRRSKYIYRCLEGLKEGQQTAIVWLICHMELLDLIDSGRAMSQEEERRWLTQAEEERDYFLMSLVLYKKTKDEFRARSTE